MKFACYRLYNGRIGTVEPPSEQLMVSKSISLFLVPGFTVFCWFRMRPERLHRYQRRVYYSTNKANACESCIQGPPAALDASHRNTGNIQARLGIAASCGPSSKWYPSRSVRARYFSASCLLPPIHVTNLDNTPRETASQICSWCSQQHYAAKLVPQSTTR